MATYSRSWRIPNAFRDSLTLNIGYTSSDTITITDSVIVVTWTSVRDVIDLVDLLPSMVNLRDDLLIYPNDCVGIVDRSGEFKPNTIFAGDPRYSDVQNVWSGRVKRRVYIKASK